MDRDFLPTEKMVAEGGPVDDEAEIRALVDAAKRAWDAADAEAYGALFTDDADYVTFVGTRYRGRAKIVETHAALWSRFLRGSRLAYEVSDVRFVTADVAVVTGVGRVLRSRFSRPRPDKVQTYVAVREAGRWLFAAFHNTKRHPLMELVASRSDPRMAPNTGPVPAVLVP
jgi:uncharacterized protein (TIGR02246 family)